MARLRRTEVEVMAVGTIVASDGGRVITTRADLAQCAENRLELLHRTVPEEGQRDVQVVPSDGPALPDVVGLPVRQRVERGIGEPQGAEEP